MVIVIPIVITTLRNLKRAVQKLTSDTKLLRRRCFPERSFDVTLFGNLFVPLHVALNTDAVSMYLGGSFCFQTVDKC
jgi:hypothetical protein